MDSEQCVLWVWWTKSSKRAGHGQESLDGERALALAKRREMGSVLWWAWCTYCMAWSFDVYIEGGKRLSFLDGMQQGINRTVAA